MSGEDDLAGVMLAAGITRLGDITGLDCLGVPVWTAYRPWSRSLSVSQGKGLTPSQARASAAFEALELAAAERLPVDRHACSTGLAGEGDAVLDVSRMPRRRSHQVWDPDRTVPWVRGVEIRTNRIVWVPWRLVSMDLRVETEPWGRDFLLSSNGLAAGRTFADALAHALAEVIERDCTTRFFASSPSWQRARRVLFDRPPGWYEALAESAARAGLGIAVWDATSPIGIPAFVCLIAERHPSELRPVASAAGMGCHLNPDVALSRAVTEAAQSRLTFIAGCRDDMRRRDFERMIRASELMANSALVGEAPDDAARCPSIDNLSGRARRPAVSGDAEECAGVMLERLARSGYREAVVVDIPTGSGELSVVKVLAPGLADNSGFHADYDHADYDRVDYDHLDHLVPEHHGDPRSTTVLTHGGQR